MCRSPTCRVYPAPRSGWAANSSRSWTSPSSSRCLASAAHWCVRLAARYQREDRQDEEGGREQCGCVQAPGGGGGTAEQGTQRGAGDGQGTEGGADPAQHVGGGALL